MQIMFWLHVPRNVAQPRVGAAVRGRLHPQRQELALRHAAALRLARRQPRVCHDPDVLTQGLLVARYDFRTVREIAGAAAAGHDEVRAPFVEIGGESGAQGREGRNEEFALGDGDS